MRPNAPPDTAMSADAQLLAAYREWQQWTQAEWEAIRASDWFRVGACQDAKRRLQSRILELHEAARRDWSRSGDAGAERERAARSAVEKLLALEQQNSALLAVQHEAALVRRAELDRSHANLRRLRHSYAPARGAAWSSLS